MAIHYIDDENESKEVKDWYSHTVRSDFGENASCCGEGDAYFADETVFHNGDMYAVITDDRDVPGRSKVAVGTEIKIPDKILDKHFQGNPTGHAILFLASGEYPICYFFGTGI